MAGKQLNLNRRAWVVAEELRRQAEALGAAVHQVGGACVIDAGVKERGSLEAGILLARACLADLGQVALTPTHVAGRMLPAVTVQTSQPLAACMASQYAGWQISVEKYFAMGSGPMRARYGKEKLYAQFGLGEESDCAVGVLETSKLPTPAVVNWISDKCQIAPEKLVLLAARTASLAGSLQVVARSVETALHKLHELHFDLRRVVAGFGSAPLPPIAADDLAAIGRTNDAVLYGGEVTLYVTGDDESLVQAGGQLPSAASRDYGRPFAAIFAHFQHDFYKIDPLLFSPASICLQNLETGRTHHFGSVNHDVLEESFFGQS